MMERLAAKTVLGIEFRCHPFYSTVLRVIEPAEVSASVGSLLRSLFVWKAHSLIKGTGSAVDNIPGQSVPAIAGDLEAEVREQVVPDEQE